MDFGGSFTGEFVADGLFDKFERPTGNDAIEREQDKGAEDPHVPYIFPRGSWGQFLKGTFGVAAGTSAEAELGEHQGDRDQAAAGDVDQDKCGTAIFAGHIGESPDISQTDYRSAHGGIYSETAGK